MLSPFTLLGWFGRKAAVDKNNATRKIIAEASSNLQKSYQDHANVVALRKKILEGAANAGDMVLPTMVVGGAGLVGSKLLADNIAPKQRSYMNEQPSAMYSKTNHNVANFVLLDLVLGLENAAATARTAITGNKLNKQLHQLQNTQQAITGDIAKKQAEIDSVRAALELKRLKNIKRTALVGAGTLAVGTPTMVYMNNKYNENNNLPQQNTQYGY